MYLMYLYKYLDNTAEKKTVLNNSLVRVEKRKRGVSSFL